MKFKIIRFFILSMSVFLSLSKAGAQDVKSDLEMHLQLNGNANDETGSYSGTIIGAIANSDRFSNSNNAMSFDGKDDYIDFGDNLDMGTKDFTVSLWAYVEEFPENSYAKILSKGLSSLGIPAHAGYSIRIRNKDGVNTIAFEVAGSLKTFTRATFTGAKSKTWYHIVGVRKGNTASIYIDGELKQTLCLEENINLDTDLPFYLGAFRAKVNGNIGEYFSGTIDDVKVFERALSDCDILFLNDSKNEILKIDEALEAVYNLDGNANDETESYNGTINGATAGSDRFSNKNKAMSFDGKDDYIDFGDNLDMGSKDFAVSLWAYVDEFPENSYAKVVSKGLSSLGVPAYAGYSIRIRNKDGVNSIAFEVAGSLETFTRATFTGAKSKTWYHIVGVRKGNTASLFINGELKQTLCVDENINLDTDLPLYLGAFRAKINGNIGEYFSGSIDDARVFSRSINTCEIDSLYKEEFITLNVPELVVSENTILYPNPTEGSFNLNFREKGKKRMTIYNSQGQLIKEFESSHVHAAIDISDANRGTYYIRIFYSDSGTIENKRLMKL